MKTSLLPLLIAAHLLCSGPSYSQDPIPAVLTKHYWAAVEYSGFSHGQDMCQRNSFRFHENGTGVLSIQIRFNADETRYNLQYEAYVPFTYSLREAESAVGNPPIVEVSFETARFVFQEMPKYDPHHIPPDHLTYVEELKSLMSGRQETYQIIPEADGGLMIEGPSIANPEEFAFYRHEHFVGSCDAMRTE